MVNDFDVIHMGGRTYNPVLGRFMQADPNIQFAGNLQSYNRYSYVMNNPMKYTDPSGYFLAGIIKNAFRSVLKLIPQSVGNFFIAIGSILCGPWAGACAAFATYEFSRVHGMSRTGALRAAAAAGVAAYAFGKIGDYYNNAGAANLMDAIDNGSDFSHLTSFGGNYLIAGQIAAQITAHAAVGGIVSSIGGGKFGHGFFSAGVTKGLGTPISDHFDQGVISGTVTQMVIGGTASVISGGKFANGAMTAAYQSLFNHFSKWAYDYQYKKKTLRPYKPGRDRLFGTLTETEAKAVKASQYPNEVDVIVAHGTTNGKFTGYFGKEVTFKEFYEQHENYLKGSDKPPILFLSFHVGSSGSAQMLADWSGRMVIAPSSGQAFIMDSVGYSYSTGAGEYWKEYHPVTKGGK